MSLRRGLLIRLRQVDPSGLALTHNMGLCGIASLDNSDWWTGANDLQLTAGLDSEPFLKIYSTWSTNKGC